MAENDQNKDQKQEAQQKPLPRWPFVLAGLVAIAFVVVVLLIVFLPSSTVYTDDAYVTAHYATVAPRIGGQISTVDVNDNQPVRAGQLLATLDDRDQRVAVAQAQANLLRDQARAEDAQASVQRQPAVIEGDEAQVEQIKARLAFAQADAQRYRNLASTGAGTFQQRQQSDTTLRTTQAQLKAAQAALDADRHQLDVLKAQHSASRETVHADQAQLDQARLNLSYTRIVAPFDGMVGERSVQAGNYVGPGATLMALVPLQEAFIQANYREVALKHVAPGQHAKIHVDAYDIDLDGVVDSVPPASGAAFAPVAPENATGNFTKIVQRLPVKIVVAPNQPLARLLRVGFSVETTIDTGFANVAGAQTTTPAPVTAPPPHAADTPVAPGN
jgi:membrane fusion protein, multidrug efflux system